MGGEHGFFFGLGPPFLGWVGGCFSLFLSYFFWDEECVGVGGEEVFWGLSLRHTPILLRGGEKEEEEEKGTTDVASSDGAGLTNPPSQKQFE